MATPEPRQFSLGVDKLEQKLTELHQHGTGAQKRKSSATWGIVGWITALLLAVPALGCVTVFGGILVAAFADDELADPFSSLVQIVSVLGGLVLPVAAAIFCIYMVVRRSRERSAAAKDVLHQGRYQVLWGVLQAFKGEFQPGSKVKVALQNIAASDATELPGSSWGKERRALAWLKFVAALGDGTTLRLTASGQLSTKRKRKVKPGKIRTKQRRYEQLVVQVQVSQPGSQHLAPHHLNGISKLLQVRGFASSTPSLAGPALKGTFRTNLHPIFNEDHYLEEKDQGGRLRAVRMLCECITASHRAYRTMVRQTAKGIVWNHGPRAAQPPPGNAAVAGGYHQGQHPPAGGYQQGQHPPANAPQQVQRPYGQHAQPAHHGGQQAGQPHAGYGHQGRQLQQPQQHAYPGQHAQAQPHPRGGQAHPGYAAQAQAQRGVGAYGQPPQPHAGHGHHGGQAQHGQAGYGHPPQHQGAPQPQPGQHGQYAQRGGHAHGQPGQHVAGHAHGYPGQAHGHSGQHGPHGSGGQDGRGGQRGGGSR